MHIPGWTFLTPESLKHLLPCGPKSLPEAFHVVVDGWCGQAANHPKA